MRYRSSPLALLVTACLAPSLLLVADTGYADVALRDAIAGNPLDDISRLEDVAYVMKGGVAYKSSP